MKTKEIWLNIFEDSLQKMPKSERNRIIEFYREMIEDKIESGIIEEEVIASLGNPYDVASKILDENGLKCNIKDLTKKEEITEKKSKKEGLPLWLTLIVGFFGVTVGIPLAISWFAVLISFCATFGALVISAGACTIAILLSIIFALAGFVEGGWAIFGAALAGMGAILLLAVGFWYCAKAMSIATTWLCKKWPKRGEKK